MYKTLKGTLSPDGRIDIKENWLPDHPVKVMVTFLEDLQSPEEISLTELGDYLQELESYEERLAKGDIRWK